MSQTEVAKKPKTPAEDLWISTVCETCLRGPCLMKVHRVDGIAVGIAPITDGHERVRYSKNRGHLCVKAYGQIQKLYNPHRIKTPLKRTNLKKGPGVDPGWVEISWDEALDTIGTRLKEIRAKNTWKLAQGGPVNRPSNRGTWQAFFNAWGPCSWWNGGSAVRCYYFDHIFGNLIHGAYMCQPDLDYCNYLLLLGHNPMATGGAVDVIQYAEARERGMKMVVIDPVFTATAAKADEWIPIKPGTDTAFLLSLIYVVIHELKTYDAPFLKSKTNSPYLVGSDGYFLREPSENKPLIWDLTADRSKSYDDPTIGDYALEGSYKVNGQKARPTFQVLKDHVKCYTPEWAQGITEIDASVIRRIATEFVAAAQIGSSIQIEGKRLPYRPVSTRIGRGVNGVARAYQAGLADHILIMLVGALEVVGGHKGGSVHTPRTIHSTGIIPGKDGMMHQGFLTPPTSSFSEDVPLIPYGGSSGKHLVYLNAAFPLENFPFPAVPEIYFNYRCNPVMSVGDPSVLVEAMKKVKLLVALAYVHSEMTELADIVLPEHNDLERYELCVLPGDGDYAAGKKFRGTILRQPVVDPLHNTMEISDIFTELAERAGFLDDYNASVSDFFDLTDSYKLDSGKKYSWVDIVNMHCLSATEGQHELSWFKQNGSIMRHADVFDQYGIHLGMADAGLRYPIPYLEHVKKTGESLKKKLDELGVEWWDTSEYVALPTYFPSVLDKVPKDYDFYLTTCASMQFSYGQNVSLPLLLEVAEHVLGQVDVTMNVKTAEDRGIKDGDYVWVESEVGRFKQRVKLREGIRPDTIAVTSFGQYATPLIKDKGWNTPGSITPIKPEWTDPVTGTMQGLVIKVKVYKAELGGNE